MSSINIGRIPKERSMKNKDEGFSKLQKVHSNYINRFLTLREVIRI